MTDECEHGHLARKCDFCCRDREIARLRGLLVKACKFMAMMDTLNNGNCVDRQSIDDIETLYGIRLRWTGETFEEDTGK